VGDTDVIKEYAGTFFQGQYSGSTDTSGTVTRNGNIDVKFGVIVDVEASRSIRQAEVGAARTIIERTEERFGLKPERARRTEQKQISEPGENGPGGNT
jgi:hypothetical protein